MDIRIVRQDKPSICSDTALALHSQYINSRQRWSFPQHPQLVQCRYKLVGWVFSYQVAFAYATVCFASGRSDIGPRRVGTHERVIHMPDEHRETRRSKFKILTLVKIVVTMQKLSRQALLKSKAELTRRKEHWLMLVPKQLGSESATPLERVFEIRGGTVRIGRWYPSDDSRLETANVADPASSRFYSGPKFQRERITGHKVEIVEDTIRLGRWHPSDDSKLETAKVADPASSHFYSGPKFQK